MKTIFVSILLIAGAFVAWGQSTTYNNNYGTNYINGKTGNFNKSSFSWTISQEGNTYTIKTNAVAGSFSVTFQKYDAVNKLYIYNPVVGKSLFDNSMVLTVMTSGKLSDYAKGTVSEMNLLAIMFVDGTGYMYKLNK